MTRSRLSSGLTTGIAVASCVGIALFLRIVLPYDSIFGGDWIKFAGADAYSHMRLVDNLLYNFPIRTAFDPYTYYPHGAAVYYPPLFSLLLGSITWLIGLGSPTPHTIDLVGAFFPAVLGTLTVIPVYFIGKELFNRWAGVLAAALVALLPGEFLGRTMLGFTDHHVVEVLFTALSMLFLILAIKTARRRQLTFSHIKLRNWKVITRPIIYSLLAGFFLGNYLLMWAGGLLFVFIIFIYVIYQFIIDYSKHQSSDYLCLAGTITFLAASVITLPFLPRHYSQSLYFISLAAATLAPPLLSLLSTFMAGKRIKPAYFLLSLVGLGAVGLTLFYFINPSLLKSMLVNFSFLTPSGVELTINEAEPFFFPDGYFSLSLVWANFTTTFYLAFISLGILIYLVIKRGEADKTLFIIWSLGILAVTIGQRRFAYYLAVNVSLLTGYLAWLILQFADSGKVAIGPLVMRTDTDRNREQKKSGKGKRRLLPEQVTMALGVTVVFFLVFFPNINPAINLASQVPFAPEDAWCESLSWLKDNTPDPFDNPDFYYELCEYYPPGQDFPYPDCAYGVMAWWDYGHWITRIAHRLPNHAPGGGRTDRVAYCFTTQDEKSANEIIDELDARYIVIDYETVLPKFHAISAWTDISRDNFFEIYYQRQNGVLTPVPLFYPEYYRSLVIRLYSFNGKEVIPQSTTVISYQEKLDVDGTPYKEVTDVHSFPGYAEAEAFVSSQQSANYRIVSSNPFISPVPLAALEDYSLVYVSSSYTEEMDIGVTTPVKIFEYTGWKNTNRQNLVSDTGR